MIDKYELIECLEWLQDKGFIQFKESAKVDMVEEYLSNCGGENAVLPIVINRTYKCDRCGTVYIPVSGIVNAGCCTAPVTHRTSGLCGGQLTEITS